MSDYNTCTQCGAEIEDSGIHYRGQVFCCDECCEAFELELLDQDEPGLEELEEGEVSLDDLDEDLEFDPEKEFEDEDLLDDEFDINPDDF